MPSRSQPPRPATWAQVQARAAWAPEAGGGRRGRSRRALVRAAPAPAVAPALEADPVPQLGPGVSMLVVSATMPMVLLVPAWLVPVPPPAAPAVPAPWVR